MMSKMWAFLKAAAGKTWAFLATIGGFLAALAALATAWFLYQRAKSHIQRKERAEVAASEIDDLRAKGRVQIERAVEYRREAKGYADKAVKIRKAAEKRLLDAEKLDAAKPAKSLRERFDAF